jgi:hypothetical protein
VDLSKFKTSDWMILGGGLLFLIGGFLDWITVEAAGVTFSGSSAFDFFFTGIIPWLLIIATAVLTVLLLSGTIKPGTVPWPMIFVFATGLATLLVLIRFIVPAMGEDVPDDIDVGRGVGLWLCLIAAIVATAGAVMSYQASGGSLRHLTDPDRLRSAFKGAGPERGQTPPPPPGAVPPPPPPGRGPGTQPPPPPPPAP